MLCQGGFEVTSWSRHGRCLCWTVTAAIGSRARESRPHIGVYLTEPILPSWQCSEMNFSDLHLTRVHGRDVGRKLVQLLLTALHQIFTSFS